MEPGWENCYVYDFKLPFGYKMAPGIFHKLTQAARRIMSLNTVAYIDFFISKAKQVKCAKALAELIRLLRKLELMNN